MTAETDQVIQACEKELAVKSPRYARLGAHYTALYGCDCTRVQLETLASHYDAQLKLGKAAVGTLAQLLPFMLHHCFGLHGESAAGQRKLWIQAYANYAMTKMDRGEQTRTHMPEIVDAFLRDIRVPSGSERNLPRIFKFYDLSTDSIDYAGILAPLRTYIPTKPDGKPLAA